MAKYNNTQLYACVYKYSIEFRLLSPDLIIPFMAEESSNSLDLQHGDCHHNGATGKRPPYHCVPILGCNLVVSDGTHSVENETSVTVS